MNLFGNIVGWLLACGLVLIVVAWAVVEVVSAFQSLLQTRYYDAKQAAMLEMAGRLFQDAYWYSEDLPTMHLLQRIATDITTHGWSEPRDRRERWQKEKSDSVNQKETV